MEQWLQCIDVARDFDGKYRVTKTSRRGRLAKALEKESAAKLAMNNKEKIYLYKKFDVEKGCGGGCGHDILRSSFFPNWNRGIWKFAGSISKNDVLVYDSVVNTDTMCCGGFEHYENFRSLADSKSTKNYKSLLGYGARKIKMLEITYEKAISLLAKH